MNESIDASRKRKDLLKHMITQLNKGEAPQAVRQQLIRLLGEVPYNDVVEVEQELMAEGMDPQDIMNVCDVHMQALKGAMAPARPPEVHPGHPVHTFREENRALRVEIRSLEEIYLRLENMDETVSPASLMETMAYHLHRLQEVDKHYKRKENLLFPFLEKHGITGPSTVMWGKHDEARQLLKTALEALAQAPNPETAEAQSLTALVLRPASNSVEEMIVKEEEILFPMSLETLAAGEWDQIDRQSPDLGFCLIAPQEERKPVEAASGTGAAFPEQIRLPSGTFGRRELLAILNTLPLDITFVDGEDRVRYFSEGRERVFPRNRAVLGREVRHCHPPKSLAKVEKILADFKAGRQDRAAFWIDLAGRFVHIEYFALRGEDGEYLGTLEVSQDLTEKRRLEGEKRLLIP